MTDFETVPDTDVYIFDHVTADTLEPKDQTIIQGDLVRIITVDKDRDDIDEVFVTVENLSGGEDEFPLFADDVYPLWSL